MYCPSIKWLWVLPRFFSKHKSVFPSLIHIFNCSLNTLKMGHSNGCLQIVACPSHKEKPWKGTGIKPQNWSHYARTQLKQCWILNTQNTRISIHIHSIFRTHPGQGIYTDFNNNNDNFDLTHTQDNFIQHTSTIFQYIWLQSWAFDTQKLANLLKLWDCL
jgi:hypothetical protein